MSVIRFINCVGDEINVKTDVTLSGRELDEVKKFFINNPENISDFDTDEEYINSGMKKLSKKMHFKYEILSNDCDLEIAI